MVDLGYGEPKPFKNSKKNFYANVERKGRGGRGGEGAERGASTTTPHRASTKVNPALLVMQNYRSIGIAALLPARRPA